MTDREKKIINLMFNDATSDGEIVNCVKRLRGSFVNGNLFSGSGSTSEEPRMRSYSSAQERYDRASKQQEIDALRRSIWELMRERNRIHDNWLVELERADKLDLEVKKLKKDLKDTENQYQAAFIMGACAGVISTIIILLMTKVI